jgi:hypothetical protein
MKPGYWKKKLKVAVQKDFYKTKKFFKIGGRITRGVTATPTLTGKNSSSKDLSFFILKKNKIGGRITQGVTATQSCKSIT